MRASGEGHTHFGIVDAAFLAWMLPVYMDLCTRDVVLAGVGEECISATGQTLVNERLQDAGNKVRLVDGRRGVSQTDEPGGTGSGGPQGSASRAGTLCGRLM